MPDLCHCPLCGMPHLPSDHRCPCCNSGHCEHRAAIGRLEPLSEGQRRQIVARDERVEHE